MSVETTNETKANPNTIPIGNDTKWEDLLAPAPIGIAVMSQMMICTSRVREFSIDKIDKTHIPLVKHPQSFRTTLMQIANESYEAFMKAHNNMEKIKLQVAQVPGFVEECDKILQSQNQNAIEKLLPRRLQRITEAANDGQHLSEEVSKGFDNLGQLIRQVLLAIEASRGAREKEIEGLIQKGIEEKKKYQDEYKQREQDYLDKEMESAQEALRRTNKDLEEANHFQAKDLFTLYASAYIRKKISRDNKQEAQKWLEIIKKDSKRIEQEKAKIYDKYTQSLKDLQIDVTKDVSTDDLIKLLEDGTEKLVELHKKWAGMTLYFKSINNHIEKVMKPNLNNFVGDATDAIENNSFVKFMRDSLKTSLISSKKTHLTAAMYFKVSENYIMKPLKIMHGMMGLENKEKVDKAQKELVEMCEVAVKGIKDMDNEDRNKALRELDQEIQSIEN